VSVTGAGSRIRSNVKIEVESHAVSVTGGGSVYQNASGSFEKSCRVAASQEFQAFRSNVEIKKMWSMLKSKKCGVACNELILEECGVVAISGGVKCMSRMQCW
jgi:hypothetical protein